MPPLLSTALRTRTAAAHAEAEAVPFFRRLAAGDVTRAEVAGLLGRLLPVYEALETAATAWATDPFVRPLLVPGLERAPALRADLAALGAGPVRSGAAAEYADRVVRAAAGRPGFVAHHYTRYLGDLSGGQVVRAALARTLGLDAASGASFLVFDGLRPGAAKRAYRRGLDALPFDDAEREQLVDEVRLAFRLTAALALELTGPELSARPSARTPWPPAARRG